MKHETGPVSFFPRDTSARHLCVARRAQSAIASSGLIIDTVALDIFRSYLRQCPAQDLDLVVLVVVAPLGDNLDIQVIVVIKPDQLYDEGRLGPSNPSAQNNDGTK